MLAVMRLRWGGKLLQKLARCPPEEEGLLQPLSLLEGGMLQPLELLEWEPPQIHEQELLQLLAASTACGDGAVGLVGGVHGDGARCWGALHGASGCGCAIAYGQDDCGAQDQ